MRVDAAEPANPEAPLRRRSLLAVAKITPELNCVVRLVAGAPRVNAQARRLYRCDPVRRVSGSLRQM